MVGLPPRALTALARPFLRHAAHACQMPQLVCVHSGERGSPARYQPILALAHQHLYLVLLTVAS